MSEALITYLNDHLGGAQVAVQLLEAMRDQNDEQEFRQFASVLLPEIKADDLTLHHIAEKTGSGPSAVKQVGGWLLEKAAFGSKQCYQSDQLGRGTCYRRGRLKVPQCITMIVTYPGPGC
jgi:hypothetical protein